MCGQNAELMNDKRDGTLHYTELSNTLIRNFKDGIALFLSTDIPKWLNFCFTNFNWITTRNISNIKVTKGRKIGIWEMDELPRERDQWGVFILQAVDLWILTQDSYVVQTYGARKEMYKKWNANSNTIESGTHCVHNQTQLKPNTDSNTKVTDEICP